jgi:hypothetical protein
MKSPTHDAAGHRSGHDRIIASLAQSSSRSTDEVKVLFAREYARLADGAKIHIHLSTLAASNVRSQLRRAS